MFDIIIKNGLICDGSGNPCYLADIGISNDIIKYIGNIEEPGAKIIDAKGKTVTPGFIDPHTHAEQDVLMESKMEPYLKQGVTTVVTGNCGYGMAPQGKDVFYHSTFNEKFLVLAGADKFRPLALIFDRKKAGKAFEQLYATKLDWCSFDEFNQKCDALPLGCNMAPLIGYSAVRTYVMGEDCLRSASPQEIKKMESVIDECMSSGAFGISTGRDPIYIPGPYATDEEMTKMLSIVASYDGVFSSHTSNRDKQGKINRIAGYEEMVNQAKGTNIKLNISHAHVMNMAKTPEDAIKMAKETLDYFDKLVASGIDLTYDVIPSAACTDFTFTSCGFFLKPLILMVGTRKELAKQFMQEEFRQKVYEMIKEGKLPTLDESSNTCWLGQLRITKHVNSGYTGKYILDCAKELNLSAIDTLMEIFAQDCDMVMEMASPDFAKSVDMFCNKDIAMPCSDGSTYNKDTNLSGNREIDMYPNSMNIGYIPRYLNRYGKHNFEKAVHQCSGFVAKRFDIEKRGIIREGNFADLVIIDRTTLQSFDEEINPLQDPKGIWCVIVNGQIAVKENKLVNHSGGKVLRKKRL